MGSEKQTEQDIDDLLRLGSERPSIMTGCVDESPFDDRRLIAYRSGRLDDRQRDLVEGHLIECAYCRGVVASLDLSPRPSAWRYALAAPAALAAGLLLYGVLADPATPAGPSPYQVVEVRGQIATVRSAAAEGGRTFDENSRVSIKVEPKGPRPARTLWVYRVDGGRLRRVDAAVEPGEDGVFWVKGDGKAMFGDHAGTKRLVMVAAGQELDADGRTLEELGEEPELVILTFEARYRGSL